MFDTLKECAKLAEESGILMNLEPLNVTTDHAGNFLRTTRMAVEMTRLIGSPAPLNFGYCTTCITCS